MGISVFPSGGGEFVTNDFVIDMNDTTNNVADLGRSYAAGSYGVTLSSGDTSFDIYILDADGNSVGYTNNASLVATAQFTQIVILGVSSSEVISFDYDGAVTNATGEGDAIGAGAYLESITPSDLPNIDDTANVIGGNFATDVEIYFESGTVSTAAKNITRSDSTALIVTRPDALDPALDPWDVKAINPGVTPPTGTNAHILAGTVDAGATPVWVTTSPLTQGTAGQSYTETLEATDADGSVTYAVTAGTLPTGLTLNSTSGVISGTPTAQNGNFTVTATDEGGNSNGREFALPLQLATGGTTTEDGGFIYHTFTSTDDFVVGAEITDAEYLIVAGGGGGGSNNQADRFGAGGGGGGGGFLLGTATISAGTFTATVGAGGAGNGTPGGNGSDSYLQTYGTAIGGGGGGHVNNNGQTGGSGGGAGSSETSNTGGSGTVGQGNNGGNSSNRSGDAVAAGGGGGSQGSGASGSGTVPGNGGLGAQNVDFATNSGINVDGGRFAGGGGGGLAFNLPGSSGGGGGGGDGASRSGDVGSEGVANTGGGGGGGGAVDGIGEPGRNGGSGLVVVRYAI